LRKSNVLWVALTATLLPAGMAQAADVELNYWLWDALQLPAYQQCATDFTAANPTIKIKLTQSNWADYWTGLGTSFVAGNAPDVFTNHVSRYPEFVANGQLLPLTEQIAADKVDMGQYLPGLAESWNKDGQQYGLPKDWDTIAFFYNKKMLEDAGVSEDEVKNMTWNPTDGGSFEKVVARLTVDANGKRGNEEGFDKSKVAVFGVAGTANGASGQNTWSLFAASDGFKYIDQPWGTKYEYDSPKLLETLVYLRDLANVKGFAPTPEQAGTAQAAALFAAGKAAIVPDGSWMVTSYVTNATFPFGLAPVVEGPVGRRSMFNGLADSIWSGTKHPAEAWQWVKYLGSAACQDVVGKSGVVFPAIQSGVDLSIAARAEKGVDVTAFTMLAKPETTFPFPISDYAGQIDSILTTAVNNVFLNKPDPAAILKTANDEVNKLF
jgi:multiple sugar transport system substrate-binding protein